MATNPAPVYSTVVDNLITELAAQNLLNTSAIRAVVDSQVTDPTIKLLIEGFLTVYDNKRGVR